MADIKWRVPPSLVFGVLGIVCSFLSLVYMRDDYCYQLFTREPRSDLFSCSHEQLSAGFPLPMIHDNLGSSPTDGWGRVGFEDTVVPIFLILFLVNASLYSLILWLIWCLVDYHRR